MNQATSAVPLLRAMHAEEATLQIADHVWDAFLSNHIGHAASRTTGKALLMTVQQCFDQPILQQIYAARHRTPCHFVPVFSAVTKAMNIPVADAVDMLLFATVRDLCSAAVRLGLIGPSEGQRLQVQFAATRGSVLELAEDRDWRLPTNAHPLQDHAQGLHQHLYSRLFNSYE